MDYPVKTEYVLNIKYNLFGGVFLPTNIVLRYMEASFREMIEFNNILQDEDKLLQRYFSFVNKNSIIPRYIPKFISERIFAVNFKAVFDTLIDTYTQKAFNNSQSDKSNGTNGIDAPFSSFIDILCERYGQIPSDLIDKMTTREIMYCCEGLERNSNELSEEGKRKNKEKFVSKTIGTETSDFLKKAEQEAEDFQKNILLKYKK